MVMKTAIYWPLLSTQAPTYAGKTDKGGKNPEGKTTAKLEGTERITATVKSNARLTARQRSRK